MKKATLLWADLEMTGLEPEKDKILEVALIATGWDLKPVDQMTAVVKVEDEIIKERMVGEFWEKNKESYEALTEQNAGGEDIRTVEKNILRFLNKNFSRTGKIILAGNSIHQDRKFVDREMPEVSRRLHYRMLDVSAWKVYFENALGKKFEKAEAHRALDDILGSIEELKYYRGMIDENRGN